MIHFSGIRPKNIDWQKLKARKWWRVVLSLLLPIFIYFSFVLGYFQYLWAFLGIIFVLSVGEFKVNESSLVLLGIFILLPTPFLLFFSQEDLALNFSIIAFIVWSLGLFWSLFTTLFHSKNIHPGHPKIHLFNEPFLKQLTPFFYTFMGLIFFMIIGLNLAENIQDSDAFIDQRVVIKNATRFPRFGNDIQASLIEKGFNNTHLSPHSSLSEFGFSESTFIFYKEDKALGDYLMSLMPEPNRKVYVLRDQSLVNTEAQIILGNLQIATVDARDLNIRVIGNPSTENTEKAKRLGDVEFIPMWNVRDYERQIDQLLVDSKVPVILYDEDHYVHAIQIQGLFGESLIVSKGEQEWFSQGEEDILILLR